MSGLSAYIRSIPQGESISHGEEVLEPWHQRHRQSKWLRTETRQFSDARACSAAPPIEWDNVTCRSITGAKNSPAASYNAAGWVRVTPRKNTMWIAGSINPQYHPPTTSGLSITARLCKQKTPQGTRTSPSGRSTGHDSHSRQLMIQKPQWKHIQGQKTVINSTEIIYIGIRKQGKEGEI